MSQDPRRQTNPGAAGGDPFRAAVTLHRAGRLKEAVANYRLATLAAPRNHGILCNLGIALKQSGQFNEAIEVYRKALALAPDFTDAHYNLGIVLETAGRNAEAEKAYRKAIALRPNFPAAQSNLGNTLKRQGRLEEAVESYRMSNAQRPDHPGTLLNLAETLCDLDRHAEALEICQKVSAADKSQADAFCQMSRALTALERYDEAAEAAQRALDAEPRNATALACLAKAKRQSGGLGAAVTACRTLLEGQPDFPQASCLLADLLLEAGEAEAALETCEALLARDKAHVETLALKMTALNALGRPEEVSALADFERLVRPTQWREVPDFPNLKALNKALSRHVRKHPTLRHEPTGNATRLGGHTGELLIEPKGPIAQLEKMICTAVEDYARALLPDRTHPFLARPPQAWTLTIWSVVLDKQGYQVPHIHPSGWLSGVYYAQLPDLIEDEEAGQAGWIEFGRPYLRHQTDLEPTIRTYQPKEGLMLLFPSFLHHRTLPFESAQTRISIAFDVMPRG